MMTTNSTEEKPPIKRPQHLILENRRKLTVTGVTDIDSFDEKTVVLFTDLGELTIAGQDLHINKLDVESGELTMQGIVDDISYRELQQRPQGSLFSRLFR